MQNLFSTTILSVLSMGAVAQTTLTHQTNALLMGESCTYNDIHFVEPGNSGPKQVWNYTNLQFAEKNPVTAFQPVSAEKISGMAEANLSILDDGYNYFMSATTNSLQELGYVNKVKNMTMVYSDPVLKMKYPFSYGDNYTDAFNGVALFSENYKIEFTGEITVSADAYGTLLMPNNLILENVMRLKSEKKGIQINRCGQVKVNSVRYAWYAEGYRYPVLIINIVENTHSNSLTPEITKTASIYLPAANIQTKNIISGNSETTVKNTINQGVNVTLFPNPFSEKITYNYFLKTDMPVTISLYDITGKYNQPIANNEAQTAGFHSGEIGGLKHALPAGVYYLRFIFGEQVIVQKFVKLEAQ
ncbi:MAG: T9SS type A sorting domain-containing protein [Bacteroidia bacterium]